MEKAVYGGDCLAHVSEGEQAGKAVFIPFTLPGEMIAATFALSRRNFNEAHVMELLEASADRVAPGCSHYEVCGGCQYQHAEYKAQVALKKSILEEMLQRAGLQHVPPIDVHTAEPWGYRNRVRFVLQKDADIWKVGYRRRASHDVLHVRECPIAAPRLWEIAQAMMSLPADMLPGDARELEIFCSADESAVQLSLYLTTPALTLDRSTPTQFRAMCEALQKQVSQLRGGGLWAEASFSGERRSTAAHHTIEVARWGDATMDYTTGTETFRVSRGAFFQVNRYLTETMVRLVTEGRKGGVAYDLFAGVGLFSQALAKKFERVIAVEVGEPAVSDLRSMLAGLSRNHHAVAKTSAEFLRTQKQQPRREFAKPELIVMDPPRAGLGDEVCALLDAAGAPEMVYVSCDPSTLARDLVRLVESGYTLQEVHLLDLFPQTFHMETVVLLRR